MNVFFIVVPVIGVIAFTGAIVYGFIINPVQTARIKVISKQEGEIGRPFSITVEMNGEVVTFRTKYYVYSIASVGDVGTIEYRGDYCIMYTKG